MDDRTPADEDILEILREGARTQSYIVDETGLSRTHVRNRLQLMEAYGWVENLHEKTALWELRNDPDEDAEE
jgi:DNA-binding IclR family transcriptional regulator